ncbi:Alpha/Beta hydrolase protein [Rhexocercosporidium sp. MPI-PUGE-AT-0058]|nr:Alpha/Beta hydrolase protein [Rhexocercosporidium sp. MPI-PUGE-AT-0058]
MLKFTTFVLAMLLAGLTVGDSFVGVQDPNYGTDVFIGIPYASRPTRLHAPMPSSGDQGVVMADKPSSNRCFEIGPGASSTPGSEDCLTLDLIRPTTATGAKNDPVVVFTNSTISAPKTLLPVYVFFHGGDFNSGDNVALGSPIIYVTVNYRLGFLGFPSGREAESRIAMNLGILDSRWSLIWLQQLITYFGGDPKKVVIGGQGSGADMVAYHLLGYGAKSDGLFRGAILHSGSATGRSPVPRPNHTDWQSHYDAIVSATGCNNSSDTWTCLQGVPIDSLVQASSKVFANTKLTNPASVFSPVVDGTFLTDFPSVLMEQGKFAQVPMLIGTTTTELINSVPTDLGFGGDASIIAYLRSNFPYASDITIQDILSYYPVSRFRNIGPPISGAQWSRVVAIMNDLQMFCPTNSQALQFSNVTSVFKYRFNSVLQSAVIRSWQGVPQGSELRYLFPTGGADMTKQSRADLTLMTKFQRSIISFINNLDPNVIHAPGTWEKFESISQSSVVFERGSSISAAEKFSVDQSVCAFIKTRQRDSIVQAKCPSQQTHCMFTKSRSEKKVTLDPTRREVDQSPKPAVKKAKAWSSVVQSSTYQKKGCKATRDDSPADRQLPLGIPESTRSVSLTGLDENEACWLSPSSDHWKTIDTVSKMVPNLLDRKKVVKFCKGRLPHFVHRTYFGDGGPGPKAGPLANFKSIAGMYFQKTVACNNLVLNAVFQEVNSLNEEVGSCGTNPRLEALQVLIMLIDENGDFSANEKMGNFPTWDEWKSAESSRRSLLFIHLMDRVLDFNIGQPTVAFCRKFDLLSVPCSKEMWEAETSRSWEVEYKRYLSSRQGTEMPRFGDLRKLSQLDAKDLDSGLVADLSNWANDVDSFGSMILSLCH